jgi:8-oxo-dGTP pyrophosphatase MutT (NUDIX family)
MDLLQEAAATVRIELAAAIVVHQERVLVVQRSGTETFKPGVWGVPCGKLDRGEPPSLAAVRELKEETGLSGRVVSFAGNSEFRSTWRGRRASNWQYNYLMELIGQHGTGNRSGLPIVVPPLTDQGWRWVPISQISDADLDDYNRDVVRQVLDTYASVSVGYGRVLSSASSSSSWRR